MKRKIVLSISMMLLLGVGNGAYAGDDASKQMQMLNSQIQTQLQQIQEKQQNQMLALNKQVQDQLKQMQTKLEKEISDGYSKTQDQIKNLQTALQGQIKQVNDNLEKGLKAK